MYRWVHAIRRHIIPVEKQAIAQGNRFRAAVPAASALAYRRSYINLEHSGKAKHIVNEANRRVSLRSPCISVHARRWTRSSSVRQRAAH